jgi:hypothetical protein
MKWGAFMTKIGRACACLIVLMAAALLMLSGRAAGDERSGQMWAICTGINDYMKNVTALHCAVNDAREIGKALTEAGGFNKENLILLTTDQREANSPTKVNIARWISSVRERSGPDDTVIFSFSGHGIQMDEEGYLLTFEADPMSEETLDASCLKISDLRKWLSRMKASRIIIFMDACRDDPRGGSSMNRSPADRDMAVGSRGIEMAQSPQKPSGKNNPLTDKFAKGFVLTNPQDSSGSAGPRLSATFFSCDLNQRSFEWMEHGMGFFSYFLVKGFRGGAVDSAGNVTLKTLEDYVCPMVAGNVEKERRTKQNPRVFMQGGASGQQWIVVTKERLAAIGGPNVAYEPAGPSGGSVPRALGTGDKSVSLHTPKKPGEKVTYTVDIISNRVKSRSYDELEHEIKENFYEADRDALRKAVVETLDQSQDLSYTANGNEADMWIFFNVCPTEEMSVDIFARDRRDGSTISKQNRRFYRPYPGTGRDLVEAAVKTLKGSFQQKLEKSVKEHFSVN